MPGSSVGVPKTKIKCAYNTSNIQEGFIPYILYCHLNIKLCSTCTLIKPQSQKTILVGRQCNSQWRKSPHWRLHIWLLKSLPSSKSLIFLTNIWLFSRKLRNLCRRLRQNILLISKMKLSEYENRLQKHIKKACASSF